VWSPLAFADLAFSNSQFSISDVVHLRKKLLGIFEGPNRKWPRLKLRIPVHGPPAKFPAWTGTVIRVRFRLPKQKEIHALEKMNNFLSFSPFPLHSFRPTMISGNFPSRPRERPVHFSFLIAPSLPLSSACFFALITAILPNFWLGPVRVVHVPRVPFFETSNFMNLNVIGCATHPFGPLGFARSSISYGLCI